MWRRWCAVAALGALQACGSTGEASATTEELGATYNDNLDDLIETEARLLALPITSEASLPTSGSAAYEGQAGIIVDNPVGLDLALVGDASVTADFGQGTISGEATDFLGTDENGLSMNDYDGSLSLSGGQIGVAGASDAVGQLSGTLTSDDHVVAIDTQVYGGFVGNPDVEGIVLYDDGAATVDGIFAPSLVGIVAER